jgi:tetratricopeptide (TPR) repeat protein
LAADKRKILEAARRHAQKGAKEKALKEYAKLRKLDPRDTKLQLEIGDARQRWGQVAEAIEAYSSVADQFMKDGFDARAVAVFKQIQNLDPGALSTYEPLAQLYQRMGLSAEAIACLQTAADAYHKADQKQEALSLLRKMALIDPSNTVSRLKVADLLHQEGMNEEAVSEYDEIVAEMEAQSDFEAAAKVFERILEVMPDRTSTLAHYARNLIDRGAGQRAEALAKRALEADPSPEHYELLAEIYRADKRDDDLVNLYRELAEVYRERGDEERGREILQRYVPLDDLSTAADIGAETEDLPAKAVQLDELSLGDETSMLDEDLLSDESLLVTDGGTGLGLPSPGSGPKSPALGPDANEQTRILRKEGEGSTASADPEQLMAEASVYLRYGKRDQAIANLKSVLEWEADHRPALERLGEAYADAGEAPAAIQVWSRAAVLAAADGEPQAANLLRRRIKALGSDASDSLDLIPPSDDGGTPNDASDDRGGKTDAASPPAPEELELEEIQLEEIKLEEVQLDPAPAEADDLEEVELGEAPEADELQAMEQNESPFQVGDLDELDLDELDLDETPPEDDELEEIELTDIEIDIDAASFIGATPGVPQAAPDQQPAADGSGASSPSPQQLADDLEEADFYLQQGLLDEAEEVYNRVLSIAPNHPHAMVRLGEVAAQRGEDPAGSATSAIDPPSVDEGDIPDNEAELEVGEDLTSWTDTEDLDFDGPTLGVGDEPEDPDEDTWSGEADVAADASLGDPVEDAADPAAELDAAAIPDLDEEGETFDDDLDVEVEIDLDLDLEQAPEVGDPGLLEAEAPSADDSGVQESSSAPMLDSEPDTAQQLAVTSVDFGDDEEPENVAAGAGFDLAAELSQALDDEAAPASTAQASGEGADTSDDGFAAVFAEFKKGVNETLSDGDYQAHYDLGIAYREMGLLDDAVGEFRNAMGDPGRKIGCLHLIGLCALDQGQPEQAISHLQEALAGQPDPGDPELALQLDLGRSLEAAGDLEEARSAYQRVHSTNPSFGDVEARLEALDEQKQETPSAPDDATDTEQYESFDDFLEEVEAEEQADSDAARASAGAAEAVEVASIESEEAFDDVIDEVDEASEPEIAGDAENQVEVTAAVSQMEEVVTDSEAVSGDLENEEALAMDEAVAAEEIEEVDAPEFEVAAMEDASKGSPSSSDADSEEPDIEIEIVTAEAEPLEPDCSGDSATEVAAIESDDQTDSLSNEPDDANATTPIAPRKKKKKKISFV